MTPQEFRATLDSLGLSQTGAARLLGVNPVTARKWAAGTNPIPPTVDRFLRYILAAKVTPEEVMAVLH